MPDVRTALSLREVWLFGSIEIESEKSLAKVLASIKIFPTDANLDLEALKSKIQQALPGGSTVQKFEEEPVAFGLVALIAHVVLPEDVEGKMDQVEESIRAVDWVSEIQVLRVGRF
jgi:elongation factor 1-beta